MFGKFECIKIMMCKEFIEVIEMCLIIRLEVVMMVWLRVEGSDGVYVIF